MEPLQYEERGYLKEPFRLFHLADGRGEYIEYHYHAFHKIIILLAGKAGYAVEGERYELSPGDFVLVGRGSIHRPVVAAGDYYERMILYIAPEYLRSLTAGDCDPSECFRRAQETFQYVYRDENGSRVRPLFQALAETIRQGGYGAALYGHLHPGKVDGYVLSGAWTRDNKGLGTGAVGADAPDLAYMPNELGDGVCSDPSVGEAYMADPYVIKEMSFGLFRALHKGHAWMRENASRFVDPVLILHGGDDGLVAPKDSLELYEQIASWDKSLRIYAGLYHEIFNEYDKDAVIEDALDWLNLHADLEFIDVEEEEVEGDE